MRLSRRGDFYRIRTQGKAFPGRFIVLSVLKNEITPFPDGAPFRFGLILTRKIGNAVTRNRIRRHMRAVLTELGPLIIPGYDVVMIARFRAPDSDLDSLRKDWKYLARKAGILHEDVPSTAGRPVS